MRRALVLALLLALVAVALLLLWRYPVGLETLRGWLASVRDWRAAYPVALAAGFFAAYVAVTALSLPLATWMTLGAGALFGFWQGLALVSFASTLGATLAFLAARWLARDWVAAHLGARAEAVRQGLARDGAFYLFTLRLIPAVPFFAVNLLMGLTPIRTWTFYWVSQVGMLAGTAVYVNAGTRLAEIDSLSGLASPLLLGSFALLGLFPWIARAAIRVLKRRRAYARWRRPKRFDRNLIVIGAGAAGLVSAYIAAATRAKVTLVEASEMGGDCLNYGCVPSKALLASARAAHQIRRAGEFGLKAGAPQVDFPQVMARVRRIIAEIAPHDSARRYRSLGVDVRLGRARLVDPWTVEITDTRNSGAEGTSRLTARAIILATGAAPVIPPLPGIDSVAPLTSDSLWQALGTRAEVPRRIAVLGGGPIGTELAQGFARLGAEVTQIEMDDRLLPREDPEASALIRAVLEAEGVRVLTGTRALACGIEAGAKWIEVETGAARQRIGFDELIIAVGRAARLKGYGLEELCIPSGKVIETDAWLQTLYPNILAAGDVAGPYQFTHTAAHQAYYAAVNGLLAPFWRLKADYRVIPWATFTDPEVARVGLSETEALEQGIAHEVTRYDLAGQDRALAEGAAQGFVKVLTQPGRDRILGATIVGAHAGEMIAEFVLAMKQGLGLNRLLGTIHVYPTLSEANKAAAGAWKRGHVNPRLLGWAERFHAWRRGEGGVRSAAEERQGRVATSEAPQGEASQGEAPQGEAPTLETPLTKAKDRHD